MDAQQTAEAGLLLNDASDALVPIGTGAIPAVVEPAADPYRAGELVHPADARRGPLSRALAWVTSPYPTLGVRAAILVVSGVNLGVSRRERELRESFCALYRAAHDQPDPERRH